MKMSNWIKISSVLLAIGVAFGALGAHALKDVLEQEQIDWWNKGVFYQLLHALGIFSISAMLSSKPELKFKWSLRLMFTGILLFSGSLYILALNKGILGGISALKYAMVPITPIGGGCLIISWILLFFNVE